MKLNLFILALLLIIAAALYTTASASGGASSGFHHSHTHDGGTAGTAGTNGTNGLNGIDGIDGMDGAPGIDGNDGLILDLAALDAFFAGAMASDAINFSPSTRNTQFGIGIGTYAGEHAIALGVGWLIETDVTEALISLKASFAENHSNAAIGLGATITLDGD